MAETIKIKKTWVGTTDPISICAGLPLFPPFPDIGAGIHYTQDDHALIDKSVQILSFRGQASVSWGVFFGLCGPGYATSMHAEGDIIPKQKELALFIKNDDTIGGYAFGTNVSVGFALVAKLYKLHWKGWHLKGSWDAVLNANLAASFDFLKVAFDVIAAALGLETLIQKVEPVKPALTSSLAMLGETEDAFAVTDGVITVHPKFLVPMNLWAIIVGLAALGELTGVLTAPSTVILAFDKLMNVTCSSIGCGPTIGMEVPVRVQIDKVKIDDTEFERTHIDKFGTWHGATDSDEFPADPKKMTVTLAHTAGFDFRVGLYAEVQILELFHAGAKIDTAILALLGIQPQTGEFKHDVTSDVGQEFGPSPINNCCASMEPIEVEFV
jgi:hypothetical protein